MGEFLARRTHAAARRIVYALVLAAFILLWALPNLYAERVIGGSLPAGLGTFALRLLQLLFAVSTFAPLGFWVYRDLRGAFDPARGRGNDPASRSGQKIPIAVEYASRRALAMERQQQRETASPFQLAGQDGLFFHLSRLFGFLLVLGFAVLPFGVAAALVLAVQGRWEAVSALMGMAVSTALAALVADAALSPVLSAYYNPDRRRLPFEYLLTLSFLSSFRMPRPGISAEADSHGRSNGRRGAA
jgi:hypothetical protein